MKIEELITQLLRIKLHYGNMQVTVDPFSTGKTIPVSSGAIVETPEGSELVLLNTIQTLQALNDSSNFYAQGEIKVVE